jgi:hypothetical protein
MLKLCKPQHLAWLEGLGKLKKDSFTSLGLEPVTFQLVI